MAPSCSVGLHSWGCFPFGWYSRETHSRSQIPSWGFWATHVLGCRWGWFLCPLTLMNLHQHGSLFHSHNTFYPMWFTTGPWNWWLSLIPIGPLFQLRWMMFTISHWWIRWGHLMPYSCVLMPFQTKVRTWYLTPTSTPSSNPMPMSGLWNFPKVPHKPLALLKAKCVFFGMDPWCLFHFPRKISWP